MFLRSYLKKLISFGQWHAGEIRQGGAPVFFRKTKYFILLLINNFILLPVTILVVILIRCLRPILVIRFGLLNSRRIGHFAGNTELYLCERDAGMQGHRTFDVFYHGPHICNQQLKKMWYRTLRVSRFARRLDRVNRLLPGYEAHVITIPRDRDIHGFLKNTLPHLVFTPEEERQGRTALQELGISEGMPFVCLHARDSAYLEAVWPEKNFFYHDYLDTDIGNYIRAAKELVGRGYIVVRTGAVVKEPLKTTCPGIIDYATTGRSDFLDIFLEAKCSFHLGSPSGLNAVPTAFRRPVATVNFTALELAYTWSPNELFIPKKLWLREEHRFLSFHEIFDSGAGRFCRSEQYEQFGVEVVENTPEEITALAVEMDERLKETWQTTKEDEELQRRFWALFPKSELHGEIVTRIGTEFLRQNRELLD